MQQFILARGQKPNAFPGLQRIRRVGYADVTAMPEFMFRPGKVVDIPDDVDMSSWVENGNIVPVRKGKPMAKEPMATPKKPEIVVAPKPPAAVSVATKPAAIPPPEPPKPPAKPPAAPPKAVAPPEPPEDAPDYEELEDGSLKCLHCDKTYKANSRAEEYIGKHVEKEHR